jgi:hypothetical protein
MIVLAVGNDLAAHRQSSKSNLSFHLAETIGFLFCLKGDDIGFAVALESQNLPEGEREMSMLHPYIGPEEIHTIEMLDNQLHCPRCTAALSTDGFSSAYWQSESIVYFCFCKECAWLGEISEFSMVTSFESASGLDY